MKILMVHNRYRTTQPSGEDVSVDTEFKLLTDSGCTVQRLELESDAIARWPLRKKMTIPFRVVWSKEGARLTRNAINDLQPDVVHFQNTFPLISPSALWAARSACVRTVQSLRNFRPICASADFLRDCKPCEICLGRNAIPSIRYGCYRGSRLASIPVAGMDMFHQIAGTWSKCVDAFIAPSEFVRSKYIEAGWPSERIYVKYNTVVASSPVEDMQPRGFVCVSRLSPEKGVDVLIDAWRCAFPDGGEGLHIVGSGPAETILREAASRTPGIIFHGQLSASQIGPLLVRCRAVVVPSVGHESFSRVVAEAFAVRRPVVASRIGALAEIVTDGENGIHTRPGDPGDLARGLRMLAGSDDLARALGRRGRTDFDTKFSPTATTQQLMTIYAGGSGLERPIAKACGMAIDG